MWGGSDRPRGAPHYPSGPSPKLHKKKDPHPHPHVHHWEKHPLMSKTEASHGWDSCVGYWGGSWRVCCYILWALLIMSGAAVWVAYELNRDDGNATNVTLSWNQSNASNLIGMNTSQNQTVGDNGTNACTCPAGQGWCSWVLCTPCCHEQSTTS